jgi:hypothetical protein
MILGPLTNQVSPFHLLSLLGVQTDGYDKIR